MATTEIFIDPNREQIALIVEAFAGHTLITQIGSANDILWGQLSDVGWMEAADLPRGFPKGSGLNAWKLTQAGHAGLLQIANDKILAALAERDRALSSQEGTKP